MEEFGNGSGPKTGQLRGARAEAIYTAVLAISTELSLDVALQRIVDAARELTSARYAALGVVDEERRRLARFIVSGVTAEQIQAIGHWPRGLGLLGELIRIPHPMRIRDMKSDPRAVGFPPNHPPMTSFLGIPIIHRGRLLGNFYMADKEGADEFSEEDEETLALFAAHAAIALENARLYTETDVQLRDKLAELETVLDTMAEALYLVGSDGQLLRANRAFDRLSWEATDDTGMLDLLGEAGEEIEPDQLPWNRSLRGEAFGHQVYQLRSGGEPSERFLSISGAPIRDSAGRTVAALNVARDITQAREMDRQRDEFISLASHELKTPLTVMKGYAQVLVRKLQANPDQPPELGMANQILSQTNRMAALADQLLDISRIQFGRLQLDRQPADLAGLVRDVSERMQLSTPDHPIRVTKLEPVSADVDSTRLEQVLANLISNAARYSPPGAEIYVALEERMGQAVISVKDRGAGILPEHRPNIFQRFYRAEANYEKKGLGLGLGLYVSQGIVEAHGGRIWFETEVGQGTTFYVQLPVD